MLTIELTFYCFLKCFYEILSSICIIDYIHVVVDSEPSLSLSERKPGTRLRWWWWWSWSHHGKDVVYGGIGWNVEIIIHI